MSIVLVAPMLLPRCRRATTLAASLATSLAVVAAAPAVGCAPRAVQVSSGPEPAAAGLAFTNHLRTAVNVYVHGPSGDEVFVRQVPAGATEALVVRGIAPGARVSLRAAPVDGARGYNRDGVTLGTGAAWTVP